VSSSSEKPGEYFEQSLTISAPPIVVYNCFFAPDALRAWWQVVRSVTTPVPFGVYAVEWATTPYRDDLLGPLGGVLHGTVIDARAGRELLVADGWWVPPEGHPIGPMAMHVQFDAEPASSMCGRMATSPHRVGGGTTPSSRATGRSHSRP
jgi:uncharacterized protein YndB with AHSA1/START domain